MRLFRFRKTVTRRSLFIQQEVTLPLEIIVVDGKRHIVGVGELGDKGVTVEKAKLPFYGKVEAEDVVKEILMKLGVPQSEWEEVLKSKKEIITRG